MISTQNKHCSYAAGTTMDTMSEYLRVQPSTIKNAVINAIKRADILGRDIMIKSDSVKLSSRNEIEFEIHTDDYTTDMMYDVNATIFQNNIRSILAVLSEYSAKRVSYARIELKLLRGSSDLMVFSAEDCVRSSASCKDVHTLEEAIEVVHSIRVVPASTCL